MVFWIELTAAIALLGWALLRLRAAAAVAAGYKAKVLATGVFGSGRAMDRFWMDAISSSLTLWL